MKNPFDPDLLVYLDSEFVARKYEETTNSAAPLTLSRSEDLTAGIGAFGFSANSAVRETRSYNVSSWTMLGKVWSTLEKYPNFNGKLSAKPVWFEGMLGVGGAEHKRHRDGKEEHLGEDAYFVLRTAKDFSVPMLTRSQFFSPGYDQIMANPHGERPMIFLHVYLLGKVLFRNPAHDVCMMAPYLIYSEDSLANMFGNEVDVHEPS